MLFSTAFKTFVTGAEYKTPNESFVSLESTIKHMHEVTSEIPFLGTGFLKAEQWHRLLTGIGGWSPAGARCINRTAPYNKSQWETAQNCILSTGGHYFEFGSIYKKELIWKVKEFQSLIHGNDTDFLKWALNGYYSLGGAPDFFFETLSVTRQGTVKWYFMAEAKATRVPETGIGLSPLEFLWLAKDLRKSIANDGKINDRRAAAEIVKIIRSLEKMDPEQFSQNRWVKATASFKVKGNEKCVVKEGSYGRVSQYSSKKDPLRAHVQWIGSCPTPLRVGVFRMAPVAGNPSQAVEQVRAALERAEKHPVYKESSVLIAKKKFYAFDFDSKKFREMYKGMIALSTTGEGYENGTVKHFGAVLDFTSSLRKECGRQCVPRDAAADKNVATRSEPEKKKDLVLTDGAHFCERQFPQENIYIDDEYVLRLELGEGKWLKNRTTKKVYEIFHVSKTEENGRWDNKGVVVRDVLGHPRSFSFTDLLEFEPIPSYLAKQISAKAKAEKKKKDEADLEAKKKKDEADPEAKKEKDGENAAKDEADALAAKRESDREVAETKAQAEKAKREAQLANAASSSTSAPSVSTAPSPSVYTSLLVYSDSSNISVPTATPYYNDDEIDDLQYFMMDEEDSSFGKSSTSKKTRTVIVICAMLGSFLLLLLLIILCSSRRRRTRGRVVHQRRPRRAGGPRVVRLSRSASSRQLPKDYYNWA